MAGKFVVWLYVLNLVNCQNWILDKLISSDYNKYEAPSGKLASYMLSQLMFFKDPVVLNASITLNSFATNEKSQVKKTCKKCITKIYFKNFSLSLQI